ncbi:hypothetical protein J2W46_006853 [Paraburkholderia strydomiana]|nr:hypothetical protein [Paraburkholderia strydomiana]
MHYTLGAVTAKALVTTVRNSFNGAGVRMAEAGGVWKLQPDLLLGAKYMYMKGNEEVGNNHAHQASAAIQYPQDWSDMEWTWAHAGVNC